MSPIESFDDAHTIQLGRIAGAASPRVLSPGQVVGGTYMLKSLIGRGGMGYVFCAEHTIIKRDYALKVLAPEMLNEASRRRFEAEGRAIAALDHINIVKVYNMGIDDGDCPFYVMDLLDGMSLSDCIQLRQGIDFADSLDIFCQIAAGLSYAHSKGIIHRDVKPSNIILLAQPAAGLQVKIVDFGIAKLLHNAGYSIQSQTAAGEVFGSPYYMSPEQCLGDVIDARADIYSLGCTLFEALSGKPPFAGQNALDTMMMHQNKDIPSVLAAQPAKHWPQSLDDLLRKMMAKSPEDRYQSMKEVIHDLERLKDGKPIGKSVVGSATSPQAAEAPAYHTDRRSWILAWSLSLTLIGVLGLLACVALTSKPNLPAKVRVAEPQTNAATGDSASVAPKKDAEGPLNLQHIPADGRAIEGILPADESPDIEKAGKEYSKCAKISSRLARHNGAYERKFDFPESSIGWVDGSGIRGQVARGIVYVTPGKKAELHVNAQQCAAIDLPQIIDRIAPDEFVGLRLTGRGNNESGRKSPTGHLYSDNLAHILTAGARWPGLFLVSINAFDLTGPVLDALDQIGGLKHLELHDSKWRKEDIRPRPCLNRLRELQLIRMLDSDEILAAMVGSSRLLRLKIDNVTISPPALLALDSCSNLYTLDIASMPISDAMVDAMTRIRSLKTVTSSQASFSKGQLLKLENCPHITLIELHRTDYEVDSTRSSEFPSSKVKWSD